MSDFKVGTARCASYEYMQVSQSLHACMEAIGGLASFVKPGQKVLIKPNLLAPRPPEMAVTTHPAVVQALAEMVRALQAVPFIGDSPGGFGILDGIENLWEITGMKEAAAKSGARLVNFEKSPLKALELRNRKKKVKVHVAGCVVNDFAVVINVCKFKTHGLTLLTGALKNMFGVMPGLTKVYLHKLAPSNAELSEFLVDLYAQVTPQLNIMDGIIGLEGEGPGSAGTPVRSGFLLASANGLALDIVAAEVMGIDPMRVAMIKVAAENGLGPAGINEIQVERTPLRTLKMRDFKLPPGSLLNRVPGFILPALSFLARHIRLTIPEIRESLCTGCLICLKSCPVQAITEKEGKLNIDRRKCIECFCCIELCPSRAMGTKKGWLLRQAEKRENG